MTDEQLKKLLSRNAGAVTLSMSLDGCFLRDGSGSYEITVEQANAVFDTLGFPNSAECKILRPMETTKK